MVLQGIIICCFSQLAQTAGLAELLWLQWASVSGRALWVRIGSGRIQLHHWWWGV